MLQTSQTNGQLLRWTICETTVDISQYMHRCTNLKGRIGFRGSPVDCPWHARMLVAVCDDFLSKADKFGALRRSRHFGRWRRFRWGKPWRTPLDRSCCWVPCRQIPPKRCPAPFQTPTAVHCHTHDRILAWKFLWDTPFRRGWSSLSFAGAHGGV